MPQHNLRHKPRISYYEPEEPALDEYVFCEKCGDYVYEYCAIHGPLLAIPDDKVPAKPNVPPYVPRAALTIPHVFLHITYSIIPGAGLGVFTSMALPSGVRFGPYLGQRTNVVDSSYCWQIYDRDRKPTHYINAADVNKSNWMRYVNCARHWTEQNLVAYQYQGKLYYRTIKIIPRFTELMVFYGSEFACELDVDLGKYNSPAGYAQKFGAPVAKKRNPNDCNMKTKPYEEDIKTANVVATTTDALTSALSNYKDITTKTLNRQVFLTSVDPEQVEATLNKTTTKLTVTKAKKVKKSGATQNNKPTNKLKVPNNKSSKIAQTKQDTEITVKPSPPIEVEESRNTELKYKVTECKPKTNLIIQNNCVLDLYIYCDSCNKRFVSKKDLQKHLRFHDLSREHACEVCKLRYTSSTSIKMHRNIHKNKIKQICEKTFIRNSTLKTYMRTHTGEKPYACEVCEARFTQSSSLKYHMKTHTGEKPYACEVCKARFIESSNLKRHMKTHTGEKPYACEVCKARFIDSSNLKRHMKTHTGEKPYACEVCEARFIDSSNLKRHMKTHTGEKPYACEVCEAKFIQNSNLKCHMKTHTGEKPYACEVCEARFILNGNLQRHMKAHTGEKPYACEVCEAKFIQNSNLKRHMKTHTGEKPYACEVCKARFIDSSNLKRHMKTHTGEKPYACEVCEAKFIQNSNLKYHMKTHTGEKPYACEICNTKFALRSNMKTHLVKIHLGNKKQP